ncbi:hypothetical protein [Pseudooceanicola spongiae]|jgi:hypothetical protein|nr:hypothetical protein [Pseudooceanicola spongiae]
MTATRCLPDPTGLFFMAQTLGFDPQVVCRRTTSMTGDRIEMTSDFYS